MLKCSFDRRLPIEMRTIGIAEDTEKRLRSTVKCALARHMSAQMHFPHAKMCSRAIPVNANATPACANELSLDACLPKCVNVLAVSSPARRVIDLLEFPIRMEASQIWFLHFYSLGGARP